ncbi:hypothetical protein PFICI_07946 [Pestalotiopsis fici W106-1]|uniref:Uncharacterized protein n=1 Tax=Pestalotiopsis fici (strain W106-1 / CGMCC3.15140) TaxID=1229662 RepID=W3X4U4_PESFW|nr:uncharacterized protein PFICI_07946 [Pestalotiopsis fici W106-1]ETS80417.1 hypothetical protein PFICI_07946 [Pestalotiopsis fici W106-1]
MVSSFQLWLSARPAKRTPINDKPSWSHLGDAAVYEPLSKADGLWYIRETHYIENQFVAAGLSGPPLHIHRLQDEFFKVEKGVLGAVKNGVEYAITKDDGIFHIPRGTRHRFWSHKTATEDLVFSIWLDPCTSEEHILDVNFLRNLSGYVNDCVKSGLKPSVLQIILMTEHASSLLCPPFLNWMPTPMLFWAHRACAWYAQSILG